MTGLRSPIRADAKALSPGRLLGMSGRAGVPSGTNHPLEIIQRKTVASDLRHRSVVIDVVRAEKLAPLVFDPAGVAAVGEGAVVEVEWKQEPVLVCKVGAQGTFKRLEEGKGVDR